MCYYKFIEGPDEIENGALISRRLCKRLRRIEKLNPSLHAEYVYWFKIIVRMRMHPIEEIQLAMQALNKRMDATLKANPYEEPNKVLK